MIVETDQNKIICNQSNKLREILNNELNMCNEIWMYGKKPYPALSIITNRKKAVVHYFPNEEHPGYISRNKELFGKNDTEIFLTNGNQEKIEIYAENAVNIAWAIELAVKFLDEDLKLDEDFFEL